METFLGIVVAAASLGFIIYAVRGFLLGSFARGGQPDVAGGDGSLDSSVGYGSHSDHDSGGSDGGGDGE